jgi:outer membrane immunogenic protein
MKTVFAATAVLALSVASASAADLGARPYAKAPMAPAFNWTGIYIGGNVGGLLHTATIDDKTCNLACSSTSLSRGGFTGGGQLGANYQFGAGVIGLEADINWANAKQSYVDPNWPSTHNMKMDWFATVRGRAGLTVDRALLYVTGGLALINQDVNAQGSITGVCGGSCFSLKETTAGIAVGAGAEYAFAGPWSAKMEYLYLATPAKVVADQFVAANASDVFRVKTETQVIRAGINYRFGAGY